MDGVVGVTQCAILPGTSFTYNFTIPADQSGTFWYHAHSAVQRADGLYGGLVVHKPASKPAVRGVWPRDRSGESYRYGYDKEILLLIGDWYHRPAEEVLSWYLRAGSYGNEVSALCEADVGKRVPTKSSSQFRILSLSMALAALTVPWRYLRGLWIVLKIIQTSHT